MNRVVFSCVSWLVGVCLLTMCVLEQWQIHTLQEQIVALRDTQNGQDIHLQFVDSDHAKLGKDIASLRQDLDNLRYRNQPEER